VQDDEQTAMLSLTIEQTSIDGYVETAPITVGETFQTQVNIASAKVYLLGEMATTQKSRQRSGGLSLAFETENQQSCTQIWCSAYRIVSLEN
jgi:hypothetical protein